MLIHISDISKSVESYKSQDFPLSLKVNSPKLSLGCGDIKTVIGIFTHKTRKNTRM